MACHGTNTDILALHEWQEPEVAAQYFLLRSSNAYRSAHT